jgi:molybdopterin-guanine dinucleotide biosynthesis protein A
MKGISGIVLAGGQGRRMGGVDKGLQLLRGKPMVQWIIERFAPQVDEVLINANQNLAVYETFGYRVIPDQIGGFAGPLAGLQRGLAEAKHGLVATVPCDSPFLPHNLVARLYSALQGRGAEIAVAKTAEHPHPVFCLCRRQVLPGLTAYLAGGDRKIQLWYATLKVVEVPFDDEATAFTNINTEEELRAFEEGGLP